MAALGFTYGVLFDDLGGDAGTLLTGLIFLSLLSAVFWAANAATALVDKSGIRTKREGLKSVLWAVVSVAAALALATIPEGPSGLWKPLVVPLVFIGPLGALLTAAALFRLIYRALPPHRL